MVLQYLMSPTKQNGVIYLLVLTVGKATIYFARNAREGAVGFSIGNKGYIGTGGDGINYSKEFWEWDQTTNAWTQKANFEGNAREGALGFSIGNKGYIGIGLGSNSGTLYSLNDFWEYNPNLK